MLEAHLIAQTRPLARPENILFWRQYRVTVLQDRLFRLEQGEPFRDDATQTVFFRDMPPQDFTFEDRGEEAAVVTPACTLLLRPKRADCRILLGGKEIKISNAGNLGGTYRTLDECNGRLRAPTYSTDEKPHNIPLGEGVCSKSGVAVYRDEASLTLGEDGEVKPKRGAGTDEYIFAYGHDFRAAVKALYLITGMPPMIPRYALGVWWSRYHAYTDAEYLRVMEKFSARRVPLSVATVDMDWHYSNEEEIDRTFAVTASGRRSPAYTGEGSLGWTGYTWNENLFPDHKGFLDALHARGVAVTLNLHPADGVRFWEKQYPAMAAALGREADGKQISFDIASPAFINAYFSVLHKPYEAEGVDFWWIDWQQGNRSGLEGLDPLWALNHYHYLDHAKNHATPLILSRYAGVGSHRYPLGFSGDTFVTWQTLRFLPYFTATASNVGYTWWSHDIGGHQRGEKNDELYLRHIEYGVFSPVCRLHGSCSPTMTKEPWAYGAAGLAAEEYLRLRHRLIPYLYSCAYRTHAEGRALVEPLYYRHDCPAAYRYPNEYYFGDLLAVAVSAKEGRDGYAPVKAWLPAGVWTDFFTGDRYIIPEGGRELVLYRRMEEFPLFASAGTVLPLAAEGSGWGEPQGFELRVYAGDGGMELYEESGRTRFSLHAEGGKCVLRIEGERPRAYAVRFMDIPADGASVRVNGAPAKKGDTEELSVSFEGKDGVVEAEFVPLAEGETLRRRAMRIVTEAECGNREKEAFVAALLRAEGREGFRAAVDGSELPVGVKRRLKEGL